MLFLGFGPTKLVEKSLSGSELEKIRAFSGSARVDKEPSRGGELKERFRIVSLMTLSGSDHGENEDFVPKGKEIIIHYDFF